ncbi:NEAT domain-containing protein [Paenibacillus massiliensis]|uniref:NEAT domain-containing protein n=1 Tax=Paenibacillus massiliensis TaxID=225917 RepID=UPI0003644938|nr:NEAT domain-containing protein [Paenibacillus massiliensis]
MNRLVKQTASVFFALCLLLSSLQIPGWATTASAASGEEARLTGSAPDSNGEVRVNVGFGGVTDSVYTSVYGHTAQISYDDQKLELITSKSLLNGFSVQTAPQGTGKVLVQSTADSLEDGGAVVNQNAVQLVFKTKPAAQAANTTIELEAASVTNVNGDSFSFANLGSYDVTIPAAAASAAIPDGTYKLGFNILKDGTDDTSVMYQYVDATSGKLEVINGKQYVSFELTQDQEITGFKTEINGQLQDAARTSVEDNRAIVRFEVADVNERLNGWVKIYWDMTAIMGFPFIYDEEYNVDLTFDTSGIVITPPASTTPIKFNVLKDGTDETSSMSRSVDLNSGELSEVNGKKYVSLKLLSSSMITSFQTELNGTFVETEKVSEDAATNTRIVRFEVTDLTSRLKGKVSVNAGPMGLMVHNVDLVFPEYYQAEAPTTPIKFNVLKDGTNDVSSMSRSVDLNSGELSEVNGKKYVSFKLLSSSMITSFQTELNGAFVETEKVSEDAATNTRIVRFEVTDLSSRLKGKVSVNAGPMGLMVHNVDLVFTDYLRVDTPIKFNVLKDGTDETSSMSRSVDLSSGILSEVGGKKYVSFKLLSSSMITSFQTELNGTFVETEKVSEDTATNTRIVRFEVTDLTSRLKGKVSVNAGPMGLMVHNVDLVFTDYFKGDTPVTPEPVPNPDPEVIADGTYPIAFNILKEGTNESSVMYTYVDQNSGQLTAANGKYHVTFTLKQSKEITSFKTAVNGVLTDTEVVSQDAGANQRTVRFEVPNPSERLKGWVQIDWPAISYHEAYNVDLVFSLDNVPGTPVTPGNPETPVTPTPVPGGGGGVAPPKSEDGVYSINFRAFYPDGVKESRMSTYLVSPATLNIMGNRKTISITVKESSYILGMQVKTIGEYEEVATVSADPGQNTRVISFDVNDLNQPIWSKVQVDIPEINYSGDYDVLLVFYPSTIKEGAPDPYVSSGEVPAVSLLEDGEYSIPLEVKDTATGRLSSVQDRFISPAGLIVSNKKNEVQLTIRQSDTVSDIEIDSGEAYKKPTVVREDAKQNARVIKFAVIDLTKPIFMNVNVAGNEHKLQITFNIGDIEKGLPKAYVEPAPLPEPVLEEGQYNVGFKLSGPEGVDQYFGEGASLTVKDGKVQASVTLNRSSSVKDFTVLQGDSYVSPEVSANDETQDQRQVTFTPDSLVQPLKAKLHIAAPATPAPAADQAGVTTGSASFEQPLFLSALSALTENAAAAQALEQQAEIVLADGEYDLELTFDANSIKRVPVATADTAGQNGTTSGSGASAATTDTSTNGDRTPNSSTDKNAAATTPGKAGVNGQEGAQPAFDRNADANQAGTRNASITGTEATGVAGARNSDNPSTGDNSPVMLYAMLMAGSAAMLIRFRLQRKKQQ